MYLLFHEDAHGCEFGEPKIFETLSRAIEHDKARSDDDPLPAGHAIVLYECRQIRILRGE